VGTGAVPPGGGRLARLGDEVVDDLLARVSARGPQGERHRARDGVALVEGQAVAAVPEEVEPGDAAHAERDHGPPRDLAELLRDRVGDLRGQLAARALEAALAGEVLVVE